MMKQYKEIPEIECLAGDTLPVFSVTPTCELTSGERMELIVAPERSPASSVICKECSRQGDSFAVQLTSDDTAGLTEGSYVFHFKLMGGDSNFYRKLVGKLYVHRAAKGAI